MLRTQEIVGRNFMTLEFYGLCGLLYFLINSVIERLGKFASAALCTPMRTLMTLLAIRGLTKNFGPVEILKGVDLEVNKGEVVSIIGASGSGKTTLLRCVNLLEDFNGGEIVLDGVAIGYTGNRRRPPPAWRARAGAAAGHDRHGVPELQPVSASHRPWQCHARVDEGPAHGEARGAAACA